MQSKLAIVISMDGKQSSKRFRNYMRGVAFDVPTLRALNWLRDQ